MSVVSPLWLASLVSGFLHLVLVREESAYLLLPFVALEEAFELGLDGFLLETRKHWGWVEERTRVPLEMAAVGSKWLWREARKGIFVGCFMSGTRKTRPKLQQF